MNRLDFFKRISLGAAAVVVAPSVVKGVVEEKEKFEFRSRWMGKEDFTEGAWEQMQPENMHPHHAQYPMTYDECYISKSQAEAEWLMQFEMDKQLFMGPK